MKSTLRNKSYLSVAFVTFSTKNMSSFAMRRRWETSKDRINKKIEIQFTEKSILRVALLLMLKLEFYPISWPKQHYFPGHEGIAVNEIADKEARATAEHPRTQIKNSKICWSNAKEPIHNLLKQQWREEWEKENSASSITKEFFSNIDKAKILQLTNTPHQLIQILSGHSRLRTFLHRIGVTEDDLCSCNLGPETIEPLPFRLPNLPDASNAL